MRRLLPALACAVVASLIAPLTAVFADDAPDATIVAAPQPEICTLTLTTKQDRWGKPRIAA